MKKKLFLPIMILIVAIVVMTIFAVASNIALKPTITEHDFPFSITYALNGETVNVEGVCKAAYTGNGGYVKVTDRQYDGVFLNQGEEIGSAFEICVGDEWAITLYTRMYPDYLMGDPLYDYYDDSYIYEPILSYSNWATGESEEGLELTVHDAKILSWELPQPIENSFTFSHIAHMSSAVVLPFLLIAVLALLATIIFVKRDKELPQKPIDKISVVINILIAVLFMPFVTIYGIFIDINGSEAAISHQLGYLAPAMIVLGLTASVALRRRGFSKGSFFVQFAGPAFFALHLLLVAVAYWIS